VLEQVRESGLAGLLVLRADVVPDVDRDDRRLVILVDEERETVLERELPERNVWDRPVLAGQRVSRREAGGGCEKGEDGDTHGDLLH
jgi:hypothetical protein